MQRKHRVGYSLLLAVVVSLAPQINTATAQSNKLVVLVRHAEKESVPVDNPVLSEAGWDRASALSAMLSRTQINHIITSQLDRTILTARYVAEERALDPETISTSGGLFAHIEATVEAIHRRPDGEAILVVGHSNTIPRIVNALTGSEYPDLEDTNYSTVYILKLSTNDDPRIIVSSFGAQVDID